MDAQTQEAVCVISEDQLTAPPGWTKKLVPASAKSITLRKFDVVFIAPDGQELKSKWHLNRYLKAHPDGPASSEFNWSSGEEAPIRRSTRFAAKEASEDDKNASRKKGKRTAVDMENEDERTPSTKRAKKAGKSAGLEEKSAVEDATDVVEKDEIMHEVIDSDNKSTQDAAPCDKVHEDESNIENLMEVEASKEPVVEKATDEGLDEQVNAEDLSATIGEQHEDIQAIDAGLDVQAEAEQVIVSSAIIGEEQEENQVEVVEVKELLTENELHADNEHTAVQETGMLVAPAEELKIEEAAIETEVMELEEHSDENLEENEDVSCKITVVTSVIEEIAEGNEKPLEPSTEKEEPLEPLPTQKEDSAEPAMQKEEQERLTQIQNSPLKVEHMKDQSPNEFTSPSASVAVGNQ